MSSQDQTNGVQLAKKWAKADIVIAAQLGAADQAAQRLNHERRKSGRGGGSGGDEMRCMEGEEIEMHEAMR